MVEWINEKSRKNIWFGTDIFNRDYNVCYYSSSKREEQKNQILKAITDKNTFSKP